jgi:hypothetical protein
MGVSKLVEDAERIKSALDACINFPVNSFQATGQFADIRKTWTASGFADAFPLEVFIDPNAGKNATSQEGQNSKTKFSTTQLGGYTIAGSSIGTATGVAVGVTKAAVKSGVSHVAKAAGTGAATGGAAALSPALIAADFIWERSYAFGFKDLYSLVSNGGGASDFFPCNCQKNDHAHPKSFYHLNNIKKETQCDDAIEWIAFRKYSDTALAGAVGVGAALTVAFAPAGIALSAGVATAAAAQQIYRTMRERVKRNQGAGPKQIKQFTYLSDLASLGVTENAEKFLSPGRKASWISDNHPDAEVCQYEGCRTKAQSRAWRLGYAGGSARHHCRVCGKIYCGDHGSCELPVLGPLSKNLRDNPPGPTRGGVTVERNLVANQRVCIDCWGAAFGRGAAVNTYIDGPGRAADTLVRNATPASKGVVGCARAQAALFSLFHGDLKQVLAVIMARDGREKVVSQAGIGVTKLPF